MIKLELPGFESMEKIRVKLDESRVIKFKDKRKTNPSQRTIIPLELKNHKERKGVYIICKNNQVKYVGATTDFNLRMRNHSFLKKNPDIKYVFFFEIKEESKRFLFEMIYKYHYFGKVKAEWNYAKY